MELLVAGHARLHATVGVLAAVSWMIRFIIVQIWFHIWQFSAIKLIWLLSCFQVASTWWYISSRIEWNQAIVSWSVTSPRARGLGAEWASHPSNHLVTGKSRSTICLNSVLIIPRLISVTANLSRLLQTIAYKVILNHEGFLSLHVGTRVRHVSICVQFLVLLPNNFWVAALAMRGKHRGLGIVSLDLVLEFRVVLLFQWLWLVVWEGCIAVRCLQIVGVTRLKATRVILLFISLTTILNSHLLLLIRWSMIILAIAIEVELHTSVDQVLLGTLIVLDLVVVNHVSKKRWLLVTPEEITLRYVSLMRILSLLSHGLLRLLIVVIRLSVLLLLLLLFLDVVFLVWDDDGWAVQLRLIFLKPIILIIRPRRCWLRWLLLRLRFLYLLLFLVFCEFLFLLFRFGKKSLFNVAEVRVLQTCKLFEFGRPGWRDVAYLSGGADDGAGDQVLIRVNQLVILQAEKHKVVDIFLN